MNLIRFDKLQINFIRFILQFLKKTTQINTKRKQYNIKTLKKQTLDFQSQIYKFLNFKTHFNQYIKYQMEPKNPNNITIESEKPKLTEIILEEKIIQGVYSFNENMFLSKTRFEMVLSQPNPNYKFEMVKEVFKGRFICKNPFCMDETDEFLNKKRNQSDSSDAENNDQGQTKERKNWSSWFKSQKKNFMRNEKIQESENPQESQRYNYLGQLKKQDSVKIEANDKQNMNQNIVKLQNRTKKENHVKKENYMVKNQTSQSKNKKWSSSMSQVFLYYYSCPAPLNKLKKVYDKKKQKKIEIYFYVELTGQICQKCDYDAYCYPFFGKTELKRIKKNFSNFFYNKIHKKKILKYRPCPLKRLIKHDSSRCQACHRGICEIPSLSG